MREYQPFLTMLLPDPILGIERNSGAAFPTPINAIPSTATSYPWLGRGSVPPLYHFQVSTCFFIFYILST